MTSDLEGLDQLLKKMERLRDRSAWKMAKAGVNAGLTVLQRALKEAVNSAPVSAQLKQAARKTVGKRLRRREGQPMTGKVGFAVGKATKRAKERAAQRAADKTKPGVGVSATNIHWFVLGTQERHTASHSTGTIDGLLSGLVGSAVAGAGPAMLEAARQKITSILAAEAATATKG